MLSKKCSFFALLIYSIVLLVFAKDLSDLTSNASDNSSWEDAIAQSTEPPAQPITPVESDYSGYALKPTWRPKRVNCTPPAIEQFPKPIIGLSARRHGLLFIHLMIAIYTFFGLSIVCDDYFVSSLDRICEELKMSADVAGATFMAAGSSAPELATVIIGVFFAKDDIGISGVIGSAVFNIMFVIAVCAICAGTVCYLNWWPLVRDCAFYSVSILIMLVIIFNDTISWVESLFMLLTYVAYCVALHYDARLEAWVRTFPLPFHKLEPQRDSDFDTKHSPSTAAAPVVLENDYNRASYDAFKSTNDDFNQPFGFDSYVSEQDLNQQNQMEFEHQQQQQQQQQRSGSIHTTPKREAYYKPKNYNPEDRAKKLIKPEHGSQLEIISWQLLYPIHLMCQKTIPDCKTEKYFNWYPLTFFTSVVWISFYSYLMVWNITIIGTTLNIPDTVMGLTFIAAGVSVPDALSSIAVIREGYGDMAVSNAIGSNVFDILICLGLPWFIQTAIIKPGSHVNVISKGLVYSTFSLLSTVGFLVVATHMNGWKLDRKYGLVLMFWYLAFIVFASMYELNVFGFMNPPECPSSY